ncbi:MAG: hypothetical protein HC846_03955, partial [Blastocatellia bacterium]|nr:hypothetical protein [Blastocatellia bacterium]
MEFKEYVDPPLDALAAAIEKKMSSYQPNTKAYPVHNLAEENLMKSKMNDLAKHKIFYIGLQQANWTIEKMNWEFRKTVTNTEWLGCATPRMIILIAGF